MCFKVYIRNKSGNIILFLYIIFLDTGKNAEKQINSTWFCIF